MPRGNVPRQPSRSARQEGTPRLKISKGAASSKRQAPLKPTKPPKAAAKKIKVSAAYDPLSHERIRQIIAGLDQMYPGVTCALTHRNAWELLVATILSAQCTDVRVNVVTPELFKKYPTIQDFAALDPEDLQPDIRSTGFFRNKSKSLVG